MAFVSYAQNFEDVILWRALKDVRAGFYIDVGAAWPDQHSVTRAFYKSGWRGINIEPNPALNEKLCADRPRDINLKCALSNVKGTLVLNLLAETGLSTFDARIANKHIEAGWLAEAVEVDVLTLEEIWQTWVPLDQDVHFLKVDVEGFEANVLAGNDWSKCRPWIVLVEATEPLTTVESYENWEPDLIRSGYILVYMDGINRFYLAEECQYLLEKFKYPPNIFDEFKLVDQEILECKVKEAEERVLKIEKRMGEVLNSKSWIVTKPFRWMSSLIKDKLK